MNDDLFGRAWGLQVDTLDLADLDLTFKVERALRREPGKATIRVYNLSSDSRSVVERGQIVRLSAGLGAVGASQIFRGDIRVAWTEREGVDFVTTLEARDGGRAYSEARFSRSYAAGTRIATVLRDLASAMDVGTGNLEDFEASLALRNAAVTFPDGYAAHGPARRILSDILRGAGLRWSIQNGALQVLTRSAPLQVTAAVLSSDSGLVESPTWDERGRRTRGRRGALTAKCLIQPGIEPGRKVRVESDLVTGDFEVTKIEYTGDTRGNDWYATITARPIT